MVITYILGIAWMLMFAFLVIICFVFTIFWNLCENPRVGTFEDCIDFVQFSFMFPKDTPYDHMKVCGPQKVKLFCKDHVEKAEIMLILATAACLLIILSLVSNLYICVCQCLFVNIYFFV